MNISILGDGGWGTAMAAHLCKSKHNITLWGPFPENIDNIKKHNTNSKFLPEIILPDKINYSTDLAETLSFGEIIVLALPSQFIKKLLLDIKPDFNASKHRFVNLAKGIENVSLMRISQIVNSVLGDVNYTVLSGPSHAEEVAKDTPTAIVAASQNINNAKYIQNAFMAGNFRIYCSDDVVGVELGGSLKNVYAIAAGISDGLNLGDNSKAALITRSIAEMSRMGVSLGGKFETFSGLSGIGDLIVTCCSTHSRNRFVGEQLGRGMQITDITKKMGMVIAEGVKTTKSAYELSRKNNIETPIIDELYSVLYEQKKLSECIASLMNRVAKNEIY